MTGWRIGYAAGPAEIIEAMSKIQSHSTSNASSISQAAAIEALAGPQYVISEMLEEFKQRQEYFYNELTAIPELHVTNLKELFSSFRTYHIILENIPMC